MVLYLLYTNLHKFGNSLTDLNTIYTTPQTVTSRSTKVHSISSAADIKSTTNMAHTRTSQPTEKSPASSTMKDETKKKRRVVIGILNWGNAANPREKKWSKIRKHEYR